MSTVKDEFLPSEPYGSHRKSVLCSPSNIFCNQASSVMGFHVLNRRFVADAGKLGVKFEPDPERLLRRLMDNLPTSMEDAKAKFGYAASQMSRFSQTQIDCLRNLNIVPITSGNGQMVLRHVAPNFCFIGSPENTDKIWKKIFDFVDFGEGANRFLQGLGVKDRPDPMQIAYQLARDPRVVYSSMPNLEYIQLLVALSNNIYLLQRDKVLWQMLQASAFLFGSAVEGDGSITTVLVRAQEIVIIDEPRLGVAFRSHLIVAPERDECELLYVALGARKLSKLVSQGYQLRGIARTTAGTNKLKNEIIQRAGIFFSIPEIAQRVRDKSLLLDKLQVKMHDHIIVRCNLQFGMISARHDESVTAVVDSKGTGCLLLVTDPAKVNYNQIAEALNAFILTKTNLGIDLTFETILKEDLEFLRLRGFGVDRLLNRLKEDQRLEKARRDSGRLSTELAVASATAAPKFPTSGLSIATQLRKAAQGARPVQGDFIIHPPTSTTVQEPTQTYCDTTAEFNLILSYKTPSWGLVTFHVFNQGDQLEKIVSDRLSDVTRFASLLRGLASVYEVPANSLHIFYDPIAGNIAFNRSGSLFFNIS
jgi:hypothetical protein